jgi:hypothetical protein
LQKDDFGALAMKGVAQTVELTCNQPHLVAIFLPLLPVISSLETGKFQGNITNCSKS